MKTIVEVPENAWAIAEAYRNTQHLEAALPFYKTVFEKDTSNLNRVKAAFWLSTLNQQLARNARAGNNSSVSEQFFADSRTYDTKCLDAWKILSPNDRASLNKSYQKYFEKSLAEENLLHMAPVALLDMYKEDSLGRDGGLEKNDKSLAGEPLRDEESRHHAERVLMIHKLFERLGQINLPSERTEALTLLQNMDPKKFSNNVLAQSTWASDLVTLAEDYRKNNEFLKAGQIYVRAAENALNWEKRAESFYKGGLLL